MASIIAPGSRWRIDNGESINVWHDPWINDNPNFKPATRLLRAWRILQCQHFGYIIGTAGISRCCRTFLISMMYRP